MSKFLFERGFSGGSSLTATDTAAGYDVANINDRRRYTKWKGASTGTKYITVEHAVAITADMIGISGHNFGTAGAVVTLEAEFPVIDGATWVQIADLGTFTSDKDFCKTFSSYESIKFRLKIVTASIAAEVGVVYLGEALDMTYCPELPFSVYDEEPVSRSEFSKNGNLLGSVIEHYRKVINVNWRYLTAAFVEDSFLPAWESYIRPLYPFFFAWDPTNNIDESYFVKLVAGSTLQRPKYSSDIIESLSFQMESA